MRGKTGGRKKVVPNKTTTGLREIITSFVSTNMETLQQDFDQLEPKERIILLEKFLKYALPAKPTEQEANKGNLACYINWGDDPTPVTAESVKKMMKDLEGEI